MLDPKLVRNNYKALEEALKARGMDVTLAKAFVAADEEWRKIQSEAEDLRSKQNKLSEEVAVRKREKQNADDLFAQLKQISARVKELQEKAKEAEEKVKSVAMVLPNIPHVSVPVGIDSRDNLEVRKWGEPKQFGFKPKTHDEIGVALGILNFEQGAKVSGARFVNLVGMGAKLERALINFMLDVHTKEHGYTEVMPPALVSGASMTGTGQLPKFEEELYKCKDDDLYLIPTAEVCVTNLHREEILPGDMLPIKYVAYTPCFRREAGSYGKDVKGLIRLHQFNKVEMVKFTEPENSYQELEALTNNAEAILKKLGLPYRVVALCTGDLGFGSAKTYDIEVWFPSEGRYREISSCSNFESFQARRAEIRFKKDASSKPEFVHTLNGSGLAIGRTFAAILENYQNEDGTVRVPDVLKPYLDNLDKITAN
ncbi:MAG: serine--tRNA ligase [Candidatus Saganbacteria bacterium]|nr:serine--tRNA ligase [Candidatus Saganbacteria bacterium]